MDRLSFPFFALFCRNSQVLGAYDRRNDTGSLAIFAAIRRG
jgi:hypothetical protein